MKKIFIPVAVVVLILAVVAIILSRTSGANNSELGYHTHENGEIHYDVTTAQEYHTHADGEIHYGTH